MKSCFSSTVEVIVGFEQLEFTVSETVGQVELCLRVTAPVDTTPLMQLYEVGVGTVEGTAGKLLSHTLTAVPQLIMVAHVLPHRQ